MLGRIRLVLEDLVNTITHLLNGFTATDKYTSIQPNRKKREKNSPDFLCELSKFLLYSLGVPLEKFIVWIIQGLLRSKLVVYCQTKLLLFQELDFGDVIGEFLRQKIEF